VKLALQQECFEGLSAYLNVKDAVFLVLQTDTEYAVMTIN
jgi:hypothetical protein